MRPSTLLALAVAAAPAAWTLQTSGTTARLRGVSAPGDGVAWATGADATILRTTDRGATWSRIPPPADAAGLDFRDVHAFSPRAAVVLAIGPGERSRIERTDNAGATWTRPYTMRDPRGFLDAIAFADADRGFALGDPIDGHFTVLRTVDGGRSWTATPPDRLPPALEGEGAFAASGTCLIGLPDGQHAWFGTGGASTARVFRTTDGGETWSVAPTPLRAGIASAGVFSLAFRDRLHGIAVGGDYRAEADSTGNVAITDDGGATWTVPRSRPGGFRSAVVSLPGSFPPAFLAIGPSGTDRSNGDGRSWAPITGPGFDAIALDPSERWTGWAVGSGGRTGRVELPDPPAR